MGVVESIGGDGDLDQRRRAAPEYENGSVDSGAATLTTESYPQSIGNADEHRPVLLPTR